MLEHQVSFRISKEEMCEVLRLLQDTGTSFIGRDNRKSVNIAIKNYLLGQAKFNAKAVLDCDGHLYIPKSLLH